MIVNSKKSFIVIIVMALVAVIIIVAWVIVDLGCGEILQTRMRNDMISANYAAQAGAEMMYAKMKSLEGASVTWPQTIPPGANTVNTQAVGGTTIGTWTAAANITGLNVFGIVSQGTVNGRSARLTVKYGFDASFTNGYPIGSIGPMTLTGHRFLGMRSWVRAEGPIASGSTITTNNYVQINGSTLENQSFAAADFWLKYNPSTGSWTSKAVYDTNGDTQYLTDVNGDGIITVDDAMGDAAKIAIFNADNTYSTDSEINNKDAFYTYYTTELNTALNLGIGPGESNYYPGDQNFGPNSVPAGTPIIFVNGDVNILFNNTAWWGADVNHTIVSMNDVAIVQPTNGSNDTLAIVAYGDVDTGGIIAFGGVRGNFIVYAGADFNAYYGGRTNGTIFAEGSVDIDTVWPIPGLLNRNVNKATVDWGDPVNWPLGLPPNYNMLSLAFRVLNEDSEYRPRWQNSKN